MRYLVGAVKEGELLLASYEAAYLLPLFGSGVHTGGVVSAGMQEHDSARGSGVKVLHHACHEDGTQLPLALIWQMLSDPYIEHVEIRTMPSFTPRNQ